MHSPFPAHAFRPGQGDTPDSPWLEAAKSGFDDAALVQKGFELLRAGYFWESHELLEKAWMARRPNSPEREMLRAIIQIANGQLKAAMGNRGAAARLFTESTDILTALPPQQAVFGFFPGKLRNLIIEARDAVHSARSPALMRLQALETCNKMQDN